MASFDECLRPDVWITYASEMKIRNRDEGEEEEKKGPFPPTLNAPWGT